MGIGDFFGKILTGIRNTKVPAPGDLISIPHKIKTITGNQKLNTINVKYWDRHFKHPKSFIGVISHDTNIPIVFFESPQPLAIIMYDDCTYEDVDGRTWIEAVEDYAYGFDRKVDMLQFRGVRYYNSVSEDEKIERNEQEGKILISLPLNRIPREIIQVHTRAYTQKDKNYVQNKIEITQNVISLIGKVQMLTRVGKKDNSFIITGVLLGGSLGTILGIIISFAFLIKK